MQVTTKIKYLSLIILLLIVAIFYSLQDSTRTNEGRSERMAFALKDSSTVDKIVFGNNILEKLEADKWRMNGKFLVDPDMMQSLFAILTQIEVKRSVGSDQIEKVQDLFLENGIEIKAYIDDEEILTYTLAGNDKESFAKQEAHAPSSIHIPGFYVNIRSLFQIDETEWRDRTVLKSNWRSLKSIQITFPTQLEESVKIRYTSLGLDSGYFEIEGINKPNEKLLYQFLGKMQKVTCESYIKDPKVRELISSSQMICEFSIEDIDKGKNMRLKVYALDDGLYGITDPGTEYVRLNFDIFKRIILKKSDFGTE